MAADELRVKLLAEDKLSEDLKDANKAVRDLKKELIAAAKEAEGSGDYSRVKQLESSYQDAQRAAGKLRGELARTRREIKGAGDQTVKSAGLMKTAWGKLQKAMSHPLVTAVSVAAVTMFAKSAIQSFAEVEDAQSALGATFGDTGDRIIAWANESAIAFNLSRKEALTAAQTMAVFGDSAGLAGQELETFAISLTERAAEAASYFGGTTADAITAFGAALRGENEPIRKYGVLLDDATLRAKAFEMGLTETTKSALTPQQKTLAAYNVIMEQTTRVQGDVARTSDSMANQIKQSQAQMENFKTTVGETLAVGLNPILKVLNGLFSVFNGLPQPVKTVAVSMGILGTAALILGPRIAAITAEMRAAGITASGMGAKMKGAALFMGGPWGAAIAAGTIVLTHFIMEQAEANARVDEFANSIDNVAGKLNDAGIERIVQQLAADINETDWQTLEKLGFSIESATAAVIGGEDAWAAYQERIVAAQTAMGVFGVTNSDKGLLNVMRENVQGLRSELDRSQAVWRAAQRAQEIAAGAYEDTADATGGVTRQLVRANPVLGEYRDKAYSASYAASALKVANQNAADATDRLTGGLSDLAGEISRQQALAAYETALDEFIAKPSDETALAVSSAMTTAASSIQDPGDKARFTKKAIDEIKTAASDAGMKLNPGLEDGLDRARGQARLLKTQIDEAVRRRVVEIELRFTDSRSTYPNRQANGGWVPGSTGGYTSDTVPTMLSRGEYVLRGGAAAALRAAVGDAGLWQLNHADRNLPNFLGAPVPTMTPQAPTSEPALVGAGAPVINIGEIKADSGIDVQTEILWAMRRADRIKRERRA